MVPRNSTVSCNTESDLGSQGIELERRDVRSIDQDTPSARVVEAREQAEDGRLARTGRTYDADNLAGLDVERDIAQDLGFVVVAERDVLEGDRALDPTGINRRWDVRE